MSSFKLIPEVSLCLSFIVEISSDGTSPSPSSYSNLEAEFREMKLHLLMEIQKRTQVEESLQNLQNLWQRLSHQLSLLGFSLPLPPSITEDMNTEHSVDPVVELSQQIFVARFVADAVARGSARAEVEMEMEPQIASKNFEITRLWDRLQYYEAANREMSHRNQEAVGENAGLKLSFNFFFSVISQLQRLFPWLILVFIFQVLYYFSVDIQLHRAVSVVTGVFVMNMIEVLFPLCFML